MCCFVRNCQRLVNLWTVQALGEFIHLHRPRFLMETRMSSHEIDNLKQQFNMFGVRVSSIGFSGGLTLLWAKETNVMVKS